VKVDGSQITTPHSFDWEVGSQHTIETISTVSGATGTQYIFQSWSDFGAQSHAITVPSTPATYTATYLTQHYLTMQSGTGGTVTPTSGWYNAGAQVQIEANSTSGYVFTSWTGSGSGSNSSTDNPAQVTVNAPITETASYAPANQSVQSSTDRGLIAVQSSQSSISGLTAIAENTLSTSGKPNLQFPYGFIHFTVNNLTPGASVTVTITYPASVPTNAQYWKHTSGGWVNMTSEMGSNNGDSAITLTLTDGGAGDQDGTANGIIVDDGGIALPPTPPTGNSGNGIINVTGPPPNVTSIQIDPGDGSNASAINVDTYYLIKVTITATNGTLSNVQRLELRLYQNSTTWPGNLDLERRQGFAWEYNGTWYQIGSSGWTTPDGVYFDSNGSSYPNLSGTQGTFTFRVQVPKVSHYTQNGGWYVQAWVIDKGNNQAWRTNLMDMNLYVHLTVPTVINWSASAGSSNVEASGMPFAISYQSNAIVKLQLNATDPVSQYGDTFSVSNLRISETTNPHGSHSQSLSGSLTDWETGLEVTDSGAMNAYWFVSVPSGQPTGTYTFTYNMNVAFDQYAT
jgi:hypothetical protein